MPKGIYTFRSFGFISIWISISGHFDHRTDLYSCDGIWDLESNSTQGNHHNASETTTQNANYKDTGAHAITSGIGHA